MTLLRDIALDRLEADMNKGVEAPQTLSLARIDDKGQKGIIITAEHLKELHKGVVDMLLKGVDKAQITGYNVLLQYLDGQYQAHHNRETR